MDDDARKFIFETVHDLKKVAVLFKETYQYLRKRRKCLGTESFHAGENILNDIVAKGVKYIKEEFDE